MKLCARMKPNQSCIDKLWCSKLDSHECTELFPSWYIPRFVHSGIVNVQPLLQTRWEFEFEFEFINYNDATAAVLANSANSVHSYHSYNSSNINENNNINEYDSVRSDWNHVSDQSRSIQSISCFCDLIAASLFGPTFSMWAHKSVKIYYRKTN